jgi:DNA-binding GntR family transcriptional regulator
VILGTGVCKRSCSRDRTCKGRFSCQRGGHPQARYRDEIALRMPTEADASILELPPGTPVAEVTRTGYPQDGTTLRVMVTIAPGDRNPLVYETDAT